MNKVFTFLLAVLYLGVSSGMALQVHYCMGKVSELTIIPTKSVKCSKCGMSGNECCRDEVKFLKLQEAHKQSVTAFFLSQPVADISRDASTFVVPVLHLLTNTAPSSKDPPPVSASRLRIIYCRFNV